MSKVLSPLVIAATLSPTAPTFAQEASLTPFVFQSIASRNPKFDRSTHRYPENHARAGQPNENAGDVRLDGVSINGTTYAREQLQLVSGVDIVIDDGIDVRRGGGNFTTGRGIGADRDSWVGEGGTSVTPTAKDLLASQRNLNLTSIVATREEPGTAIFEARFDAPVDRLLVFERGSSGDVLVSALDDAGRVFASYKVRDGQNDGPHRSDYVRTGIFITTFVKDGFVNQGQELGAVGLQLSRPATRFRFTSLQEPAGEAATRFNGPDLKLFGLRPER